MMDVSGTDPRTRTGLFLWPWASYPAAAANAAAGAHSQQIMMGAGGAVGAGMGANMLGVPHSGSGSLNVPAMEDPFETFYQRFSYPGAHAAHMSHILPPSSNLHQPQQQQQQQLCGTETRHMSPRDRNVETPNNLQQGSHMSPSPNTSRTHGSSAPRLLSPQPRIGSHLQRNNSQNDHAGVVSGPTDPHAAAIAAFASVAANSAVMGVSDCGPPALSHTMHASRQGMHHSTSRTLTPNEMSLSNLCNGRSNQHFNSLPSAGLHSTSSPSPSLNASPTSKSSTDAITAYNHLRSQHLKDFSSTAAALAAAVASDRAQFAAHMAEEMNNDKQSDRDGSRQALSNDSKGRVQSGSQPNLEHYHPSQQHFQLSSKSPLSDSSDTVRGDSLNIAGGHSNRNSLDFMRNGRLLPGLRDKSSSLLFRNSSVRDCSTPDTLSDYRSSTEMLMSARDSLNPLRGDDTLGITPNQGSNGGSSSADTPKSTHCVVENSNLSLSHTTSSYTHPAKGYKCKICQHVCFSRHDLSAHNAATHKQDPRPYRCEQCGRQFTTGAYLSQHRRIHTGVKPYACHYCDRHFTQLSHVQQHERIHTGEKPYRCTTCMKSFTQMSNLQSHQRQHMKGKPHRCEQCFMSFDTKDELDLHVQAKHSGNRYAKVLVCPICTKSYNSETYLAKHMDRHKEAANTAPADSSRLPGTQSSVDDLFAASFHANPMARAAAALSLGGAHAKPDSNLQGRHHSAAAVAAAVRCAAAAAAVSGGGNVGTRGDPMTRPFFNSAACSMGESGLDTSGIGLHSDPVNYSNLPDNDLFPRIPGIHNSRAAHLMAAAAAQHHQQQQQQQHNAAFGKLSHLANPFQEFKPQTSFGLGHADQYSADIHHSSTQLHNSSKRNVSGQLLDNRHPSRCLSASVNHTPSPHPPYVESPSMGSADQQLLNLTQSQPLMQNTKQHLGPSSTTSSSPNEATEHYGNPASHMDSNQQRIHRTHRSETVETAADDPPPAHQQHCPRLDPETFEPDRSGRLDPNRYSIKTSAINNNYDGRIPPGQSNSTSGSGGSKGDSGQVTSQHATNDRLSAYMMHPPPLSPQNSPRLDLPLGDGKRTIDDGSKLLNRTPPQTTPNHKVADDFVTSDGGQGEDTGAYLLPNPQKHRTSELGNSSFLTGSEIIRTKRPGVLRVDVSLGNGRPVSPDSSSCSGGNSQILKEVDDNVSRHDKPKIDSNSAPNPLSTPLLSTSETGAVEQNSNSCVVSELAKMLPNTRIRPRAELGNNHSGCGDEPSMLHSPTAAIEDDSITGLRPDGRVDISLKAEDYQNRCSFSRERQLSTNSSPLSVEMHSSSEVTLNHLPTTTSNMRASPGIFGTSSVNRNMFYPDTTADAEDPIRSSWACKELIPPKSASSMSAAELHKTAEQRRAEALFSGLVQRRGALENQTNPHVDGSKSVGLMNIPFYLDPTWRQYAPEETRFQKSSSKGCEQREMFSREVHLTNDPNDVESVQSSPLGSPKRRRRNHCVPQHPTEYEQQTNQSPHCAFPNADYYRHPSLPHEAMFEEPDRRHLSGNSSNASGPNSSTPSIVSPILTGASSNDFNSEKSANSTQTGKHPVGDADHGSSITPTAPASAVCNFHGFQF
ncbi:hypothetical protein CRM22_010076 [Opisthorchis felineus]|uniref:C2H2-type domain-containing protein n=1 Tax=Opisthorchis felineus TaxID=147828 RepID=A0A4S2L3P7_OPIFE|nr:hypothetical protein CRM22_010076 [Opisthorchis felineus]